MVVLEVAQAALKHWKFAQGGASHGGGVYLVVYFERKPGFFGCCCGRRSRDFRGRDLSLPQARTDTVPEAREMLWRRYNGDNFLVPIFTLEGSSWRTFRRDDVLTLGVDVFRASQLDVDGRKGNHLILSLRGTFRVGVWGMVECRPTGADPNAEEGDYPLVTFELRPQTMRPFSLDYARPECPALEPSTDAFGRRCRVSVMSMDSGFSLAPSGAESPSWSRGRASCGSLAESHCKKLSVTEGVPGRRARTMSFSSFGDRISLEATVMRRPEDGESHWSTGDSATSGTPAWLNSESQGSDDFPYRSGGTDEHGPHGVRRRDKGRRGRGANARAISSRVRNLVRRRLRSAAEENRHDAPTVHNHWLPESWEALWKSQWPEDNEHMGGQHDIVPLMEAEFRRDCIVLFNTLYPHAHGKVFSELRELAFDTGGSKVGFKLLSDRKAHDPGARTWSTDLAQWDDFPVTDDLQRQSEDGIWSWLNNSASEATRAMRRSFSRQLPEGSNVGGAEGSRSSFRKSLGRVSLRKIGRDSLPALSPDAAVSTRSSSMNAVEYADAEVSSCSWDSHYMGEGEGNERTLPETPPVEPSASSATKLPNSQLDHPMKLSRELSYLPASTVVSKQPCVCTVSTPKGLYVDCYSPRIMLLKRMLLCFAACGVSYTEVASCLQLAEAWPYPLAAVLGHGSRVLIRLEDVEASEFINFLMFGDPNCVDWKENGVPYPLVRRLAATHSVQIEPATGNLVEKKLQVMSAADTVQNISDGMKKKHLGLDLPIGGVGNPSPLGADHFVEFSGRIVQRCEDPPAVASRWSLGRKSRSSTRNLERSAPEAHLAMESPGATGNANGFSRERTPEAPRSSSLRVPTPTQQVGHSPVSSCCLSMDLERCSAGLASTQTHEDDGTGNVGQWSISSLDLERSHAHRLQQDHAEANSLDTMGSPCGSQPLTPMSHAKLKGKGLRVLPGIQGGHLYMRIDDFGERTGRNGAVEGNGAVGSRRGQMRRRLQRRPREYQLALEQAKLRVRVQSQCNNVGEVFFPSRVPIIRSKRSAGLHSETVGGMTLLRVSSEPSLMSSKHAASAEDVKWAKEMIVTTSRSPLKPPPSPEALRLFLEHLDPLNTQLFGTCGFKSMEDFYKELRAQRSFLMKRGRGLRRYVEPVILQLRWKGHILMLTHELSKDEQGMESLVPMYSFVSASMRPDEHWKDVLYRTIMTEFNLDPDRIYDHLEDDADSDHVHQVLQEETSSSPSYPGLHSFYRAHMVEWRIRDDCAAFFMGCGLPVDVEGRRGRPHGCDFSTRHAVGGGRGWRMRFWRWVPEGDARELQRYLNMSVRTVDDRWAKYAFQSEGVVQFPPTAKALSILFSRCGVDLNSFGQGKTRTLQDLWLELLNQESSLLMTAGQPHRIVETLYLRLRGRARARRSSSSNVSSTEPWQILVKTVLNGEANDAQETSVQSRMGRTLLSTKKYRNETWEDCALRCISMELGLKTRDVRNLLDRQADDDDTRYAFHEVVRASVSFPGILTLYRTHLVTMTVKEDTMNVMPEWDDGCRSPPRTPTPKDFFQSSLDITGRRAGSRDFQRAGSRDSPLVRYGYTSEQHGDIAAHFEWLNSDSIEMDSVRGMELWVEARKHEVRHKVSSVLIGLEGSAPNKRSPFGTEHNASGVPNKISALGNRKWHAYRMNNALQIPSDEGGMHLRITRQMFQEFIETCDKIGLVDPVVDLVAEPGSGCTRDDLERRHAEKELMKQLLAGSGRQAQEAVELMKEYASTQRSPTQAYAAMHRVQHRFGQCQDVDQVFLSPIMEGIVSV